MITETLYFIQKYIRQTSIQDKMMSEKNYTRENDIRKKYTRQNDIRKDFIQKKMISEKIYTR